MKEEIQYFNSQDAAKILGVNVSSVKRWTAQGKLQCIKSAGGHRKFLMSHLSDFLKKQNKSTSRVNLFPIENEKDLEISHHILKGDFSFLRKQMERYAFACSYERVQQILNGLYLAQYSLPQIYDELVTPVLHKIGDLWQTGKISIAQEHLYTQVIRESIIRLQGILKMPKNKKGSVLLMNLSNELHDMALKMVANILEFYGYKILFTGQKTPIMQIEELFTIFKPQRVYLSVTVVSNLSAVQAQYDKICQISADFKADVYIGGQGVPLLDVHRPAFKEKLSDFQSLVGHL